MEICSDYLLQIFDCRNFKGDYLGRSVIALLDSSDDPEDPKLHRHILDCDPILKDSCTWKYRLLDCALVKDYGEFDRG